MYPKRPYSPEDIETFVAHNLILVGSAATSDAARIHDDFVEMIGGMPPWQQIIMIEGGGDNIAGDREDINRISYQASGNEKPVLGFCCNSELYEVFNRRAMRLAFYPILWRVNDYDEERVTLFHEQGHRNDSLSCLYLTRERGCVSDKRSSWQQALNHEIENLRRLNQDIQAPLYNGYSNLANHLRGYKADEYNNETMAEMVAHYNALYYDTEGNHDDVDEKFLKRYPFLWPVFRDEIIPEFERYAQHLWAEREAKVSNYIVTARNLSEAQAGIFDLEETKKRAHRSLLNGEYADGLSTMDKAYVYSKSPLSWFTRVMQEKYKISGREVPNYIIHDKAYECISHHGDIGAVSVIVEMDRQNAALRRFIGAHYAFAYNVGLVDIGEAGRCLQKLNVSIISEKFDEIVGEYGCDGVDEVVAALHRDASRDYFTARKRKAKNINYTEDFLYQVVDEICNITLTDPDNDLNVPPSVYNKRETDLALKREIGALEESRRFFAKDMSMQPA